MDTFFSVDGKREFFNFSPSSSIWLKDTYDDIYEEYIYYFIKNEKGILHYFETPNPLCIVENTSFSFKTEKECIDILCRYYYPKLSKDGAICQESLHSFSSNIDHYVYDLTLYPDAVCIHIDFIIQSKHKYQRDLDSSQNYILPPIKVEMINHTAYRLIDGFHRVKYSKEKQYKMIPAILI